MKKLTLVVIGLLCAAGMFYISRNEYPPKNEQVQGVIGAWLVDRGASVCVVKLQNTSDWQLDLDTTNDALVAKLNKLGFKSRVVSGTDTTGCDASVYGEIVSLKGKNRVEAEVDFRLVKAGIERPVISSSAKGKSSEVSSNAPLNDVTMSMLPKARQQNSKEVDTSSATREALAAALDNLARQIETQRPVRSSAD